MIQRHYVVVKTADGPPEKHPMKQWLRNHPDILTEMDPDHTTSHELRRALKSKGWTLEETPDQILLVRPDVTDIEDILKADQESPTVNDEEQVEQAQEITFGLERDLQAALRAHIEQLEPGLHIIDNGKERVTDAGRIDITAIDPMGNIVVIELKAGTAQPEAVAQVLAYMGAVGGRENAQVRGILVAGDFHKRVVLASRAIPTLRLKKYSFQFAFESIT
jgi:RecB family endonuclease NucS